MDSDNAGEFGKDAKVLCRKAWTAYLPTVLLLSAWPVLIVLAYPFAPVVALVAGAALYGLYCVYRWIELRSVRLFYDDSGVWVYAGVFPWSRGVRGVKWRDLDEGTYEQSFWSWVLRSYAIRVSHRFTKDSEINLTHMYNGQHAVIQMNEIHRSRISAADDEQDASR